MVRGAMSIVVIDNLVDGHAMNRTLPSIWISTAADYHPALKTEERFLNL